MNDKTTFTWYLHITGQVQGVGYRPAVFRISQDYNLVGYVKNMADGLHVVFNATKERSEIIKNEVCLNAAPSLAIITAVELRAIPDQSFIDFRIVNATDQSIPNLIITPDIALCDACNNEISDDSDRRKAYGFNSCSHCGPRYSIINDLPYDREHTEMDKFVMCSSCAVEYNTPSDRRYYAQTITCPNCAISLQLYDAQGEMISSDDDSVIKHISNHWNAGKIIAIKGIGGFLLTCDATNEEVIRRLRKLKHRPTKPFAIMYPDLGSLVSFDISTYELQELKGHVSPVVLISKEKGTSITKGICDNQDRVGVMLPYAPIFKVLLSDFGKPIVATSGNVSNSPIIFEDEDAIHQLSEIADYILVNDRDIVVPQDDSVVKYSKIYRQKIVLRRSRGLAPSYINSDIKLKSEPLLAMGAQLKSTFALHQSPNTYVSQYIGDLESIDTIANYKHCLNHLIELLKINPTRVLCDLHEGYASTLYAYQLAERWNVTVEKIQHHKAHFSAIIGEHNLIDCEDPVLGVIWDGAGFGTDDAIWGSEFFVYQNFQFDRCAHLDYYNLFLGDKMAKEPRLAVLSIAHDLAEAQDQLRLKFSDIEWGIYSKKLESDDHVKTSSMGRLFDAVSPIVGLCDKQSFEGEAAMLLEVQARDYFNKNDLRSIHDHYLDKGTDYSIFSAQKLLKEVISDVSKDLGVGYIAAKFHVTLVNWIAEVAKVKGCNKIAFSGGVFQNDLLVDLTIEYLSKSHNLYFHQQLAPNDENISFGQLIYHEINSKRLEND